MVVILMLTKNLDLYIYKTAEEILITSVEKQLVSLAKGFFSLIPEEIASILRPDDLQLLLCGL
jgi:hypothetical protein